MVDEWRLARLGDHISLKGGLSYKGAFVDKGAALLVGMGCVSHSERFLPEGLRRYGGDFSESHRLSPGDIVIATRQQSDNLPILGYPAMIPDSLEGRDIVAATNLYKVTNHSDIENRFVYWLLRGKEYRERILKSAKGTTVRMLTKDSIEDFEFFCPPARERNAIATFLDALDDKIELNRRMNATLEAMARTLFQSWFVDFDPVRAKLDCRQLTGLGSATAALFPNEFEESELGPIPQGWRIGTLGELVELRIDRVDATPAKNSSHYIALEDMPSKSIDLSRFQLGSAVNSSIIAFRKGDVLFGSMRPYFHKVGLAFFDGITRTTTFVLRPAKRCFRHFALFHFFSDDVIGYSTTASVGTTIPYVRWDSLNLYRIPIPPDPPLVAFDNTVSPLVQRIAAQGEESRRLATVRDALLPKLLTGQLRIAT